MLRAENVSHAFSGVWVLRDLSLTVAPGEVLGLSGPSGAGKTTLARILSGGLVPQVGRVGWEGEPGGVVRHVPQAPEMAVDPRWTIAKVLRNGGEVDPEVIAALGIRAEWAARRPGELSGGELARVSLARFLGPATKVLICDEISAQLDALAARDLWQALVPLARRRGIALVIISHDPALRRALCEREIVLDGQTRGSVPV